MKDGIHPDDYWLLIYFRRLTLCYKDHTIFQLSTLSNPSVTHYQSATTIGLLLRSLLTSTRIPFYILHRNQLAQSSQVPPSTMGQSKSKPQADVQPGILQPLEQEPTTQNLRPWAFTFFPRPEFAQQPSAITSHPIQSTSVMQPGVSEPQMTVSQTQRHTTPQRRGTITDGQGRQIYVNRARYVEQERLDQRGGHWMQENPLNECAHMCSTCWINICTCSCRY